MARVLGLGGVFFKASDPKALAEWYARVLGFKIEDWGGAVFEPSKSIIGNWSPFPADTRYFEPSAAPFMVNFVVDDLDGVLARAAAEGVEPTGRQDEGYGRFAWLVDPEGLKIELWQPTPEA